MILIPADTIRGMAIYIDSSVTKTHTKCSAIITLRPQTFRCSYDRNRY